MPSKFRPLQGSALFNLEATDIGGATAYSSTNTDPQMVLFNYGTETRYSCGPGKYAFYFQARVLGGAIRNPKLYFDFGSGFAEEQGYCETLVQVGPDLWMAQFVLFRSAIQFRFDPSESHVNYVAIRLDMEERGYNSVEIQYARLISKLPIVGNFLRRSAAEGSRDDLSYYKYDIALSKISVPSEPIEMAARLEHFPASANLYEESYFSAMSVAQGGRDPSFAPIAAEQIEVGKNDPKVIAFYLPQFHPFAENDEWWGRGFTEWTNVSKAIPQFEGHYQPRLPGELGFYDLRLPEVMARQFELARHYGISAFCYHYYYFDGKRLLERPINQLLEQKGEEFDFPFCLCWANENWTRRWDGAEHDVLIEQNHSRDDFHNVFEDLLVYLKDPRYLTIDGRPIVVIYRPTIIPDILTMVGIWREKAATAGFPGIYLIATTAFGFSDAESIGFDAICQFPPHAVSVGGMDSELKVLNPSFSGNVFPYSSTVDAYLETLEDVSLSMPDKPYFPGVMMGWDNEARKPGRGHVFHNASPKDFYRWLAGTLNWTQTHNKPEERLVFVNAWNEWAEGTYLEPDRRFGYAYLTAVAAARRYSQPANSDLALAAERLAGRARRHDTVLIVHIFYSDLIDEFVDRIQEARQTLGFDVIVSIPEHWETKHIERIIENLDPSRIVVCSNYGRDVWPFIQCLKVAEEMGYLYGCKLHSKKSLHLTGGGSWRDGLVSSLIGKTGILAAMEAFKVDKRCGLVAPAGTFVKLHKDTLRDNKDCLDALCERLAIESSMLEEFVAGTMFWFRVKALKGIVKAQFGKEDFGPELGAIDGTMAHAFERIFVSFVRNNHYAVEKYDADGAETPYKNE